MKKNKIIVGFLIATMAIFTACEKDAGISPNGNATASKSIAGNNDKAGGITESDIITHTKDLLNGDEPSATFDLETTLKLLETAVNTDIGNFDKKSYYSERLEIEVDLDYTESEGVFSLDGQSLDYFNTIKDEVEDAFTNSTFYATHGSSSFISVIDFEGLDNYGSSPTDKISVLVDMKYDYEPLVPFCSFDNDWKAYQKRGDCSAMYAGDAALRMESMLMNSDCNSQLGSPGFTCVCDIVWYDIKTRYEKGRNDSRIWNGNSGADCLSKSDLNNIYEPGAKAVANDLTPTWTTYVVPSNPLIGQINYYLYGENYTDPITSSNKGEHVLVIQYAQLIQYY